MEDKEIDKMVGRKLQYYRKMAGYKSAAAFANAIGMNTATYTTYEQGITGMKVSQLIALCNHLGVPLSKVVEDVM